ncbi:avr3a family secreted RxLR effector peptide protein, putative [Phytophthora infestans T30-4]|uniref:RxLR effector protein n=3 Tax=Phytophthora infestans TaxID=4787 RepID=D0NPN9_PHYIT|nr:avr3a family secreted RxLR effector peptide protein, putative [Phytophthora infestans T30-4]EEY62601.1 avr3a family secreted RxLR effector peptide protein, putative [Phytophthora infestans T30-4]KAF4145990.1 RXLR effector domain-containing protein [Phytophthora infestans]CAI72259.1 PEX147-3 precursor [Phytophthora infestans]CAI72350.1 PEX147-3 [Phytophthora infestans]|eukprot:XP_002898843.1 avr3a family secreted RxLR effector peptide protein, putative [Phytophthora infestans T30-4]
MRLAIMLSTTAVATYLTTCSAIDQTKVLMYGTPAHYIHDSAGRRFLRKNEENEETSEERAPNFNLANLNEEIFNVAALTKKADAKKLAKQLMGNDKMAKAAYVWWQHNGVTPSQIDTFLKLASGKTQGARYNEIYNSYLMHLGLTAY